MTNLNKNSELLENSLSEAQLELLLLLLDGELGADAAQQQAADELLAQSEVARVLAQDWRNAKRALREGILQGPAKILPQTEVDLSLLHGRIMSKLPADAQQVARLAAASAPQPRGLWAWIQHFGFGKTSFAIGAAVAVAVFLLVRGGGLPTVHDVATTPVAPDAAAAIGEPQVIIEEMELESGSVMVNPAGNAGDAMVIWHFHDSTTSAGGEG